MKSAGSRKRWGVFDLLGAVACVWFAVQASVDARALTQDLHELDLNVDSAALAQGFRPGVEWFSIYKAGDKIGFIRNQRARDAGSLHIRSTTRVWLATLGEGPTQLELNTHFDLDFTLQAFDASVKSNALSLDAHAELKGEQFNVHVQGLGSPLDLNFPARSLPRFNQSLRPALMREDLQPNQSYRFEVFDPMTMQAKDTVIEYVGQQDVTVLGAVHRAHHLRQQLAGESLDSWVNDLGEVLREDLPGELQAVRESEAEAVWGLPGAGTQVAP